MNLLIVLFLATWSVLSLILLSLRIGFSSSLSIILPSELLLNLLVSEQSKVLSSAICEFSFNPLVLDFKGFQPFFWELYKIYGGCFCPPFPLWRDWCRQPMAFLLFLVCCPGNKGSEEPGSSMHGIWICLGAVLSFLSHTFFSSGLPSSRTPRPCWFWCLSLCLEFSVRHYRSPSFLGLKRQLQDSNADERTVL